MDVNYRTEKQWVIQHWSLQRVCDAECGLRSFDILRGGEWYFRTDVSGRPTSPSLTAWPLKMGPDRLHRNVETKLPFSAASYPKRAQTLFTPQRKPEITHSAEWLTRGMWQTEERGGYLETLRLGHIVKRPTTTILQTIPAECQSAPTWTGDNERRRMMNLTPTYQYVQCNMSRPRATA
jgi:hypothetical protein